MNFPPKGFSLFSKCEKHANKRQPTKKQRNKLDSSGIEVVMENLEAIRIPTEERHARGETEVVTKEPARKVHVVDTISRMLFPGVYLLFNVVFWIVER